MSNYITTDIRNFVLVGHGSTGKTTLAEALLFKAGATKRQGSVDEGSSNLDYDSEEKNRKYTLDAKLANFSVGQHRLNMLDTPGYPDYISQAIGPLNAVETAIFVVCTNSPVAANTRALWKRAGTLGLGRVIVINKMDAENSNFISTLGKLRESFGERLIPYTVPEGEGPSFSAVHKVLAEDPQGLASEYKDALMEAIVEADDDLMEKFLEGEVPSKEEMQKAFVEAVRQGSVCPVLVTSALQGIGLDELTEFIQSYCPDPTVPSKTFTAKDSDEEVEHTLKMDDPLLAQVFKVVVDPFVGRIGYVRVYSGTLKADQTHTITDVNKPEKLSNFNHFVGKESHSVSEFIAGDIGSIAKCDELKMNRNIFDEKTAVVCAPIAFPVPLVSLAVTPKSQVDEKKLGPALSKLAESDPCFKIERKAQTKELVMSGMSDLHLQVQEIRLRDREKVEIETTLPRIPFYETITGKAESKYRHKKQSGGSGQFGEVWLRIEPKERGEGFEFVNAIVGGVIPGQFMPAVEKGIKECMEQGVISGNQVVDVRVEVFDGKHHPVDSKEIAFKTAGRKAFQQAFVEAKPVLLEPIANVETTVPTDFMGAITGDIPTRRGRIQGMEVDGDCQVIKSQIPLKEMQSYSTELRSITQGEGTYTIEMSHYDVVPSTIAQPIIAATKKVADDDG